MHALETDHNEAAMLKRDVLPSCTYQSIQSQHNTLLHFGKRLHDSNALSHSCKQRIPVRKSSKTFGKLIRDTSACQLNSQQPSQGSLIGQTRPTTEYSYTNTTTLQQMAVPRRSTSLKSRPKPRSRPDSVSLRNRGCKLFSSIDGMLALAQEHPSATSTPSSEIPTRHTSLSLQTRASHSLKRAVTADEYLARTSSSTALISKTSTSFDSRKRPQLDAVISWTSDRARKAEYEKIDRAHSGVRGFCKQLLPRAWLKDGRRNFFDGECDGDSVRRFRVPTSEKGENLLPPQRAWSCF